MRISDWSSDVCSSDLHEARIDVGDAGLCEQAVEEEAGEVFEVADGDLQEVIHVAGQRVAGDDFVPLVDEVGQGGDGIGVVVVGLDADEGLQAKAQGPGAGPGTVAGDEDVALQEPQTAPTDGGW